jgi:hypothetical protein
MIGDEPFSCGWKNRILGVNYRAEGRDGGELVSIEPQ